MVRVLVRIFAVIGLLSVLLMGGGVLLLTGIASDREALPEAVVLRLDLERPLRAAAADDPLEGLVTARGETLRDVVDALDRAAKDPRVKGLVARVGNNAQGIAATQELRAAVSGSGRAAASPTCMPRPSASSPPACRATTSPAASSRSGCSPWAMSASPASW